MDQRPIYVYVCVRLLTPSPTSQLLLSHLGRKWQVLLCSPVWLEGGEEGDPGLDIFLPVLHFSSAFPHFAPTKDGKKRNVLPIYSVSVLIT